MAGLNGELNGHNPELEPELPETDDGAGDGGDAAAGAAETGSYVLRDLLRSREYEVPDELDDDTLLSQFQQAAERAERFSALGDADPNELIRYAEAGRKLSPYEAQIEQLRQQAAAATAPAEVRASAGQLPAPAAAGAVHQPVQQPSDRPAFKYDAEQIRIAKASCRQNEHGLWEPVLPFDADRARFLNDAEMVARQNQERLLLEPDAYIDNRFATREQQLREQIRQELMQELGPDLEFVRETRLSQIRAAILGPRESELVAGRDASGNPSLSPKGLAFQQAYDHAPQGLNEPDRLNYALALADQWELQQSRTGVQTTGKGLFSFAKKTIESTATPVAPKGAAPSVEKPRDSKGRFIDAGRKEQTNGAATLPTVDRSTAIRKATERERGRSEDRMPTFRELLERNRALAGSD